MIRDDETELIERFRAASSPGAGGEPDSRYALSHPPRPPGLYWRLRWFAGRVVRWLRARRLLASNPWPVSLTYAGFDARAKPLVVLAIGTHPDALVASCRKLAGVLRSFPEFAPVLVTDVARFAFFSRLGWLVEYLPDIAGSDADYPERKFRLLARRYRGAPIIPLGAASEAAFDESGLRALLMAGPRGPAARP